MGSRREQRIATERLGLHVEAGGWCVIDAIPRPPSDVVASADNPRLHPGRVPALGMAGVVLRAPFIPVALFFGLLAAMENPVVRTLASKGERSRLRAKRADEKARRKAIVEEYGLAEVFDGNWHGNAGQFLLRWYGHSPHHERLLLVTPEGIVLAAPPRRVSVGREKHMRVVARLPADGAALVDPFAGEFPTTMLLIRFRDGSWLRVETEEPRSALHMHALRQPLPDSWQMSSGDHPPGTRQWNRRAPDR